MLEQFESYAHNGVIKYPISGKIEPQEFNFIDGKYLPSNVS